MALFGDIKTTARFLLVCASVQKRLMTVHVEETKQNATSIQRNARKPFWKKRGSNRGMEQEERTVTDKMKLDYNNLIRLIMGAVSEKRDDEETQNTAFTIAVGLELLSSYLKDIAMLAIKRNDDELLELCKGLLIVTEDDDADIH